MSQKEFLRGDALVNRVVLLVMEVITFTMMLGYMSDYSAGNTSLRYFLIFELAAAATFVLLPVVYKKSPDKMKHVAFVCFTVVYTLACFGAHIDVGFVMAFPIVVIFILYYDFKLIRRVTVTFNIVVLLDVIYQTFGIKRLHSGDQLNTSVVIMELLSTTIFCFTVRAITKISNRNNEEKLQKIQADAEKVNVSVQNINGDIIGLNQASRAVKGAMEEINLGVGNVVDAVQNQMLQTEAIQNRIEQVSQAADKVADNLVRTLTSVTQGNNEVAVLAEKADDCGAISEKVTQDLLDLRSKIENMGAITKIIENIAFHTNIMALNANVEAARAGEAGLGFAVVASEISNMSAKTKEATENIEEIIKNANGALQALVTSVADLDDIVQAQKAQSVQTSAMFDSIQGSTEEVKEHMSLFMNSLEGLSAANKEIVLSVHTISATTQQVGALTNEATNMEANNAVAVQNIVDKLADLCEA